jgi:hypothetical protein
MWIWLLIFFRKLEALHRTPYSGNPKYETNLKFKTKMTETGILTNLFSVVLDFDIRISYLIISDPAPDAEQLISAYRWPTSSYCDQKQRSSAAAGHRFRVLREYRP